MIFKRQMKQDEMMKEFKKMNDNLSNLKRKKDDLKRSFKANGQS
jgi:hypothetical protein